MSPLEQHSKLWRGRTMKNLVLRIISDRVPVLSLSTELDTSVEEIYHFNLFFFI